MLRKRTLFMSAQPDHIYFHWQIEVFINNFISNGINPNWINILIGYDGKPSDLILKLVDKYKNVKFFFYKRRLSLTHEGYVPIVRSDLMEQHFTRYPELRGEVIFFHDADMIFRELPDFDSMHDDSYWYLSDTVSYIGSKYIKSKSDDLFIDMCSLVNISPEMVERNEIGAGGAQYLMKGLTANYWKTVISDARILYKYMCDREKYERSILSDIQLKTYNPIQKWCADMWTILWGAWKIGAQTVITTELDFSWGTSTLKEYNTHKILHNAGVTDKNKHELFYKADYRLISPFESDLSYVKPNTASAKYVEAIQSVKIQ